MKPYLKLYRFFCLLLAGSLASRCGLCRCQAKTCYRCADLPDERLWASYEVQFTVKGMDQEFGDARGSDRRERESRWLCLSAKSG
ncbi:MAG: hypothetical protein ACLR8Y_14200 [Alistipes indistinctus]